MKKLSDIRILGSNIRVINKNNFYGPIGPVIKYGSFKKSKNQGSRLNVARLNKAWRELDALLQKTN